MSDVETLCTKLRFAVSKGMFTTDIDVQLKTFTFMAAKCTLVYNCKQRCVVAVSVAAKCKYLLLQSAL